MVLREVGEPGERELPGKAFDAVACVTNRSRGSRRDRSRSPARRPRLGAAHPQAPGARAIGDARAASDVERASTRRAGPRPSCGSTSIAGDDARKSNVFCAGRVSAARGRARARCPRASAPRRSSACPGAVGAARARPGISGTRAGCPSGRPCARSWRPRCRRTGSGCRTRCGLRRCRLAAARSS